MCSSGTCKQWARVWDRFNADRKTAFWNVVIAAVLKRMTQAPNACITENLGIGQVKNVSYYVGMLHSGKIEGKSKHDQLIRTTAI